jgi:hypothetical protein
MNKFKVGDIIQRKNTPFKYNKFVIVRIKNFYYLVRNKDYPDERTTHWFKDVTEQHYEVVRQKQKKSGFSEIFS